MPTNVCRSPLSIPVNCVLLLIKILGNCLSGGQARGHSSKRRFPSIRDKFTCHLKVQYINPLTILIVWQSFSRNSKPDVDPLRIRLWHCLRKIPMAVPATHPIPFKVTKASDAGGVASENAMCDSIYSELELENLERRNLSCKSTSKHSLLICIPSYIDPLTFLTLEWLLVRTRPVAGE
jgi:hypothetical protein